MIRLSWLQFRAQAVTAAAALAAAAVTLAATSPHRAQNTGTSHFLFIAGIVVLYLTPALIGTFWGAPLISRELETGTYRLAWTQSVSRTRWLAVKLGLAALASMATAGLLSLMVTWWSSPIDQLNVLPQLPAIAPAVRRPRPHPGRLRRLRPRPRRHHRTAPAPRRASHRRHPRGLRRRPGRRAPRGAALPHPARPHRITAQHQQHHRRG